MCIRDSNHWHFGIGLTVCRAPESYPEELILIHIIFRKEGDDFKLRHTFSDQEFSVNRGDKDSYTPYFEDLFQTIVSSYKSHIQQFIGEKTTRKLGYVK